jgi:hypothetical protein
MANPAIKDRTILLIIFYSYFLSNEYLSNEYHIITNEITIHP